MNIFPLFVIDVVFWAMGAVSVSLGVVWVISWQVELMIFMGPG